MLLNDFDAAAGFLDFIQRRFGEHMRLHRDGLRVSSPLPKILRPSFSFFNTPAAFNDSGVKTIAFQLVERR